MIGTLMEVSKRLLVDAYSTRKEKKYQSRYVPVIFSWVCSSRTQNFLAAGTGTTGCICVIFIECGTTYDRTQNPPKTYLDICIREIRTIARIRGTQTAQGRQNSEANDF